MKGFYNLTDKIKTELEKDAFVNTVTYGDIFDVDLKKHTIYPLSHFLIGTGIYNKPVWTMTVTLICMDIVDYSKENETDFRGNDNEQDVFNTQLAVINRLLEVLDRGDLHDDLFQLVGTPSIEAFVDRFDADVAGWTVIFEVNIVNDMTIR